MNSKYDLHTHSTASDGTLSPKELIYKGAEAGIKIIALTDHDTLSGLNAASMAANNIDLKLIPGVEISVSWSGITIHIVGLGINPNDDLLKNELRKIQKLRFRRAKLIGEKLETAGFPHIYESALNFSNGKLVSRTHFARAIIKAGHASTISNVFRKFLVKGKPGYVKDTWASLPEAIHWVKSSGGQAVIAHPAKYRISRAKLRSLLRDFKNFGGEGLEVISGCYDQNEEKNLAKLANEFNLLGSIGSDYHGPDKPWIKLGKLPEFSPICRPIWHDWASRHQI